MEWDTMQTILDTLKTWPCKLVDITGGAPEMNPHFRRFVLALRAMGLSVQVRTNLTVMLESGFEDFPQFFRDNSIQLIASLPCYLEKNVRAQRGVGVYQKSIEVIQRLNALGYGIQSDLSLSLVYNPLTPVLPPPQEELEREYRQELFAQYGIHFSRLFTITNVPIGRYMQSLAKKDQAIPYTQLLSDAFNPETTEHLMCRHQISIRWDGTLYDCDFNLALDMPVNHSAPNHIDKFDLKTLLHRKIMTGQHCYACTAGAGSSCGGTLTAKTE
jgi:radical SAM/Cys-rich protein